MKCYKFFMDRGGGSSKVNKEEGEGFNALVDENFIKNSGYSL